MSVEVNICHHDMEGRLTVQLNQLSVILSLNSTQLPIRLFSTEETIYTFTSFSASLGPSRLRSFDHTWPKIENTRSGDAELVGSECSPCINMQNCARIFKLVSVFFCINRHHFPAESCVKSPPDRSPHPESEMPSPSVDSYGLRFESNLLLISLEHHSNVCLYVLDASCSPSSEMVQELYQHGFRIEFCMVSGLCSR